MLHMLLRWATKPKGSIKGDILTLPKPEGNKKRKQCGYMGPCPYIDLSSKMQGHNLKAKLKLYV